MSFASGPEQPLSTVAALTRDLKRSQMLTVELYAELFRVTDELRAAREQLAELVARLDILGRNGPG